MFIVNGFENGGEQTRIHCSENLRWKYHLLVKHCFSETFEQLFSKKKTEVEPKLRKYDGLAFSTRNSRWRSYHYDAGSGFKLQV